MATIPRDGYSRELPSLTQSVVDMIACAVASNPLFTGISDLLVDSAIPKWLALPCKSTI